MFDISFLELVVLVGVTSLFIKKAQIPLIANKIGLGVGRAIGLKHIVIESIGFFLSVD